MISDQELFQLAKAKTNKRVLSESATAGSVASALVTAGGNVFVGVCIDAACGIGFCAEHNAIGSMITEGESAIAAIVAVNPVGILLGADVFAIGLEHGASEGGSGNHAIEKELGIAHGDAGLQLESALIVLLAISDHF